VKLAMNQALIWLRRDLRLGDHPALNAALRAGLLPILCYVHDPKAESPWQPGAASEVWLHHSLEALSQAVAGLGGRLIIRVGDTQQQLEQLIEDCGAVAVYWNRLYEPALVARDQTIKQHLRDRGIDAQSFNGSLLLEPWQVKNGSGEPYRVFTPFWRSALTQLEHLSVLPTPSALPPVDPELASVSLAELKLLPNIPWDQGFYSCFQPGERGAHELLEAFVEGALQGYKAQRNFPDRTGTSKLSAHLHFGEISPRQILLEVRAQGLANGEDSIHYASELGWREFAHHLIYHFPASINGDLNPRFKRFEWCEPEPDRLKAWQQGRTGVPIVDAGMRELWQTGWMHNRVRMIVASFLTKNLRYHWLHGARWFWDTLLDADLANNTMGWQWTAGTGADAAPYYRIFAPSAQTEKFDPQGEYIKRFVPELAKVPADKLAEPSSFKELKRLAPDYPDPIVDIAGSRKEALAAFSALKQPSPIWQ
jgi:deoxyribodipyrimidine photo-lyase